MIKVSVFLGICIAIYAIFSYLEVKIISKISIDITMEFLKDYEEEIIPHIIEGVTQDLTTMFLANSEILLTLGALSAMKEVIDDVNKEKVSEAGAKNYEESQRN